MILPHILIKTEWGKCLLCDNKKADKIHLQRSEKKTSKVLDLGCCRDKYKTEAFYPDAKIIGVDFVYFNGVDVIQNFENNPLPFRDNQFDMVICWHILEHLNDTVKIMNELHRILKPGGIIFIRVPHFLSMGIWQDITHKKGFSYLTFDCINSYTDRKFEIIGKKMLFFHLNSRRTKKYFVISAFGKLIEKTANKFPIFYERILGYYVGGMDEILLKIKVVK